jgi:outer membrane protein assembly factor BamB
MESMSRPLRLWPGVVLVVMQWVLWFGLGFIDTELFGLPLEIVGVFAGMACGLAIVIWWLFFSRAPWVERIGALAMMVAGVFLTLQVVHMSIANGMRGMMLPVSSVPYLCLALVLWAGVTRSLSTPARRVALVAAIALACLPWTAIRTAGVSGAGSQWHWRWTPTPEEKLLAQNENLKPVAPAPTPTAPTAAPSSVEPAKETPAPKAASPSPAEPKPATPAPDPTSRPTRGAPAEWPGFRGPRRDAVVPGIRINTDWSSSPPKEMWRRQIGPGWSSFAIRGDFLYTQEQRGEHEIVGCYRVSTGEPVWRHRDPVRFWESNGGAGPRGTPAVSNGRVYAFGATGILNALNADTGALVWTRNVAADTGRQVPEWGFASSPLVVDDVVVVAAAATLAAYDVNTGEPRWRGPSYGGSYSSPHLVTVDGVQQIVILGGPGAVSVSPSDGAVLWQYKWSPGAITQPAVTSDGDILINAIVATGGLGTRRLAVAHNAGGWNIEERWASMGLKPYFNDLVVHKGHAYGFDGSILASIDLTDGQRKWKGGRYGSGQMVLLPEQDLLLVVSEEGELALVEAKPDGYKEVARFKAIEGKTWNHPALIGDVLLVRNDQEMAAFKLALASPR